MGLGRGLDSVCIHEPKRKTTEGPEKRGSVVLWIGAVKAGRP